MKHPQKHTGKFASRFKRRTFGWRSTLPIKRVKEAIKEIKACCARKNPLPAADFVPEILATP